MKHFSIRLLVISLSLAFASLGNASSATRDIEHEEGIEKELQQMNPALVPVFKKARIASVQLKYDEAAKGYAEVLAKAPRFDHASRRLGAMLLEQGRYAEGMARLEQAVALRRSWENLGALAHGLMREGKSGATKQNLVRARELLTEAKGARDVDALYVRSLATQLSLQDEDYALFRRQQEELKASHPNEIVTRYYSAIREAMDENWVSAEREILEAGKLGMPEASVRQFLQSGVGSRALAWKIIWTLGGVVATWALAMFGLFLLGFVLSKLTLREVESPRASLTVSPGELRLRRIYRAVVNVAGLFYYISLPVIILIVVGVCAGILYGFMMLGILPIKIALILVVGAALTIFAMGKSLFVKVKTEEPGRVLERREAESLYALVEEVALVMGTRPIDEIRITPGTDLAVFERGTWREKMQNNAKRVLILGVATLRGFKLDDFRCVLAHEYGHFSNRDTAGGEIALRVRNDMAKFYYAMAEQGQATLTNLAFHFLRLYNFIFRRITHGATRLQEVLADRVAAQAFGSVALEGGLRQVILRSIEFDVWADKEVQRAIEEKRPLNNFYGHHLQMDTDLATALDKAFNRPTTEDDTHPSPVHRIRLVASLPARTETARSGEVLGLFSAPGTIEAEMLAELEKRVAPHRPSE